MDSFDTLKRKQHIRTAVNILIITALTVMMLFVMDVSAAQYTSTNVGSNQIYASGKYEVRFY